MTLISPGTSLVSLDQQDSESWVLFLYEKSGEHKTESHFNLSELISMVTSLVNQGQVDTGETVSYRDVVLDLRYHSLLIAGGEKLPLPFGEAKLLRVFLENPGKVLSRDSIQTKVWPQTKVTSRSIDSHISRLRRKLEGTELEIESLYRQGYILK